MAGREIACGRGVEQVFCDGWPVELVVYEEPWSIVRDRAGAYRALTRTLGTARGGPLAGRGLAAGDVSPPGPRAVHVSDVRGPTSVRAFWGDLPREADG